MSYIIVPIAEKYIEGFHQAVDSVARERKYLAFLEGPTIEQSRAFVMENLEKHCPHFIALDNDRIIGWCDITHKDFRPIFAHSGELGVGVVRDYRGFGIGKKLIQAALNNAKQIGLTRVELKVRENNNIAIALYKKMGFLIEGLQHNAIKIENIYENLVLMGLCFN